jgi:hypothetical protein
MAEASAWITIITPLLLPHRSSAELAESDEPAWNGYDWDIWDIETCVFSGTGCAQVEVRTREIALHSSPLCQG